MLKGRQLTLGMGRGAAIREFDAFRVPMAEARGRFNETLDILRKAMSNEWFSHEGEHFTIPETTIRPSFRNPQRLMDRMRIAWTSPETLPIAANAGVGMLMTNQKSWDDYAGDVAAFNSIRARNGLEPTQPTVVIRMVCAETEEEAWEAMKVHSLEAGESSKHHYQFDDPERFKNTKGYEQYAKLSNAITDQETLAQKSARPQAYGTPDQVFEKLKEVQAKTSAEEFVLNVRFGAMPIEQAERSMRLFAKEVLPRLHELDTPLADSMRGGAEGAGHVAFGGAEEPTRLGL